jgi:hypothetical protein
VIIRREVREFVAIGYDQLEAVALAYALRDLWPWLDGTTI